METCINYEELAMQLLTRFKDFLVTRWQQEDSNDNKRFISLVKNNTLARDILNNSRRLCHIYDNPEWQSRVMDTLDLELIYSNVDKMSMSDELQYSDNLVKELLRYFKEDFFHWCNKPECNNCHTDSHQEAIGMSGPNEIERQFQCGNVELYKCGQCQNITRFPRYNDPVKLLETRTGRCGEWCNLFMLILKSFGLDARYVINLEDHVWNEYYSPFLKRWIHLDSCENAFDNPTLYCSNWCKKMSYCIAYGQFDVVDVSDKYIKSNALPRDKINESDMKFVCSMITKQLRQNLNKEELFKAYCMGDQDYLNSKGETIHPKDNTTQEGRQSGSQDWVTSRGEAGK